MLEAPQLAVFPPAAAPTLAWPAGQSFTGNRKGLRRSGWRGGLALAWQTNASTTGPGQEPLQTAAPPP